MGHRALVAYQRSDRLYDLRYSHWGGTALELAAEITPDRPLARGAIDADRLADAVALDSVLTDFLDPCGYEALFLVTREYDVHAYRVLWLEWADGRERGRGAIVSVTPGERDLEVRVWFRATKTVLADVIEMGLLSWQAAQSYLEARVNEDEDGYCYTYGDRSRPREPETASSIDDWLEDDRWW